MDNKNKPGGETAGNKNDEAEKFENPNQPIDLEFDDIYQDKEGGDDEGDEFEEGRQNFVTGVPESEIVYEQVEEKPARNYKQFMVIGVVMILFAAIALFFIVKGSRDDQGKTVVKDNSDKFGINAAVDGSVPNFEDDYKDRYSENNANVDANVSTNANTNDLERVGNDITAPPDLGTVYDPNRDKVSPAAELPNGGNGNGRSSSSGGGSSSNNPTITSQPQEVTEIKPTADTVVIDESGLRPKNTKASGGRSKQVSLYFFEPPANNGSAGKIQKIQYDRYTPVKPPFGTVLPVRILGRLHTLGTKGLARMELTRTVEFGNSKIPRGTMFVGRVAGSESDRLFISLVGYIDKRTNRLVTLGGDLQGNDGALGIKGDVRRIGSKWKKVFGEMLDTVKDVGTAYLLGRSGGGGTIINNGSVSRIPDQLTNETRNKYVVVQAGTNAYLVLTDLPPAIETDSNLAKSELSDDEILKLIETNSDDEIKEIMPELSQEGRQIARRALGNK